MWSPEVLGAAAEQMLAEQDPEKAKALGVRIVAGFYGDAGAKIRRHEVPRALMIHLVDRVREREIGADQLTLFAQWLD